MIEINGKSFGQALTDVMAVRGYTDVSLARDMGVPPAHVARWMSGKSFPRREVAERLCRRFSRMAVYLELCAAPGEREVRLPVTACGQDSPAGSDYPHLGAAAPAQVPASPPADSVEHLLLAYAEVYGQCSWSASVSRTLDGVRWCVGVRKSGTPQQHSNEAHGGSVAECCAALIANLAREADRLISELEQRGATLRAVSERLGGGT